jgi:hypothetical protein
VDHVFPVAFPNGEGMIVHLRIQPALDWEVSDASGTFCFTTGVSSPAEGLAKLLELIENACDAQARPFRWRAALSISIRCPLRFHAIEGESLQVPPAVATVRALCAVRLASGDSGQLPFGEGPVFCSGMLDTDGRFLEVENLGTKLDRFCREYGNGGAANLTGVPQGRKRSATMRGNAADYLVRIVQLDQTASHLFEALLVR